MLRPEKPNQRFGMHSLLTKVHFQVVSQRLCSVLSFNQIHLLLFVFSFKRSRWVNYTNNTNYACSPRIGLQRSTTGVTSCLSSRPRPQSQPHSYYTGSFPILSGLLLAVKKIIFKKTAQRPWEVKRTAT